MIKAVIFDIDGVLIDSLDATLDFFQTLLSKFGYHKPTREDFAKVFHLTMKDTIRHFTKSTSEDEINKIWEAGKNLDVKHEFLVVPEDSEKIVSLLSEKYPLGIVTSKMKVNIYKAPQMKKLEKYFKTAIGYDDVKNHKPNPEPLLLASKNLGILPEECVYIGDMENDLFAGRNAGMKVIMFRKSEIPGADSYAKNFSEIPSLIENL